MDVFKRANITPTVLGPRFVAAVDTSRVLLLGHSRGGAAVVRVAANPGVPEVSIAGVVSLAPADDVVKYSVSSPLMVVLPAADGDVMDLIGSSVYDSASAETKLQVYVHGANHNWFNTVMLNDDADKGVQTHVRLTADQQKAVLRAYSSAFFAYATSPWYRDIAAFPNRGRDAIDDRVRFSDLPNDYIFLSFRRPAARVMESHDVAPALTNDWGGVTSSSGWSDFGEFLFKRCDGMCTTQFGTSFVGDTNGLITGWVAPGAVLNHPVPTAFRDQSWADAVTFRVGKVVDKPSASSVLRLQLLSSTGMGSIDTDAVGIIPDPYPRAPSPASPGYTTRTVLNTFRVPVSCLKASSADVLDLKQLNGFRFESVSTEGAVALDDLSFAP